MSYIISSCRNGLIWVNGKLIPWNKATTHILSHGLNNASCVFDGERVYGRKIFRLTEHMQRFLNSASILGIDIPFTLEELITANKEVVLAQNIIDGYIRSIAWLNDDVLGISSPNNIAEVAIAVLPWRGLSFIDAYQKGISLQTSKWIKPAPDMSPYEAKASCHYAVNRLSQKTAKSEGYDDALFLDYRGYISESTGSNVFIVRDGKLLTPIPDCFLDGITRKTVITLAKKNDIDVVEKHITPSEFIAADEVFLTGTAYEIMPVSSVDKSTFVSPGVVTQRIINLYREIVNKSSE